MKVYVRTEGETEVFHTIADGHCDMLHEDYTHPGLYDKVDLRVAEKRRLRHCLKCPPLFDC